MAEGISLPIDITMQGASQSTRTLDALMAVLANIDKNIGHINVRMEGLGRATTTAMSQAERTTESFSDKLGKLGLAIQGVKGIVNTVAGAVAPIFEEGLGRIKTETLLKNFLPDGTDAKAWAKDFRESMLGQLYGSSATDAATQMMSFGIDEKTTKAVLNSIGNIAGGDANKLNSLALAFAQVSSAGKLGGQDLMQMIGQGFNPLAIMAEKTGKSMAELKDEMGKGAISAQMVQEAFISASAEGGKFNGVMDNLGGGVQGQLNTVSNTWADLKASLFESLVPLAESILPKVSAVLKGIVGFISSPAFPFFATILGSMAVAMKTYGIYTSIAAKWTTIMTAKQWLLNVAMNANPVGLVVAAVVALIAVVTACIKKYDEWGAALSLFLGPLGMVINLVESFKRHWDSIAEAFESEGIIAGIKRIGQVLLDSLLMPVQQLLSILSNIPGLGGLAGKGASAIANLRKSLSLSAGIVPGQQGDSAMGGGGGRSGNTSTTSGASANSAMAKGTQSAVTGGTRSTAITINMGSLVHQISYNGGIDKNNKETTAQLQEALLRALNGAVATAG